MIIPDSENRCVHMLIFKPMCKSLSHLCQEYITAWKLQPKCWIDFMCMSALNTPYMLEDYFLLSTLSRVNVLSESNFGRLITRDHLAYMNLQTT